MGAFKFQSNSLSLDIEGHVFEIAPGTKEFAKSKRDKPLRIFDLDYNYQYYLISINGVGECGNKQRKKFIFCDGKT